MPVHLPPTTLRRSGASSLLPSFLFPLSSLPDMLKTITTYHLSLSSPFLSSLPLLIPLNLKPPRQSHDPLRIHPLPHTPQPPRILLAVQLLDRGPGDGVVRVRGKIWRIDALGDGDGCERADGGAEGGVPEGVVEGGGPGEIEVELDGKG